MKKIFLILLLFFISLKVYPQQENSRWIIAVTGLRLRTEPSLSSQKIALIPSGEEVKLLETSPQSIKINSIKGNWVKIKWNNKTGWVFSGYLTESNPWRWVSSKSGLPYRSDKSAIPALIPYGEKVINTGPSRIKNRVSVIWQGGKVYLRNEFLSSSDNFKYNYPELRRYTAKKLQYNHNVPLHPEDLFIKKYGWIYHIIYVYRDQDDERAYNESLWISKDNNWEELEVYGSQTDYMEFLVLDINNDSHPDVIGSGGCCSSWFVQVYLGQPGMTLKTIFDASGDIGDSYDNSPAVISTGKCNDTVIEYNKRKLIFNCETSLFE